MSEDESRSPVDQALDLFVYLPVGFVFELPRSIPRFIERGRRELGGNGRITGTHGLEVPRPLDRVQAHAVGTLRALGVLPPSQDDVEGDLDVEDLWPEAPAPEVPAVSGRDDTAPLGDGRAVAEPGVEVEALAIPGYDSLSASQVMPRLESLAPDELELVRRYEHTNRGRKTILNKIAQLQAG